MRKQSDGMILVEAEDFDAVDREDARKWYLTTVDKPGLHAIMFSMREDGFEFDRFMLTKQQNAMESKNSEVGPAASPQVDGT